MPVAHAPDYFATASPQSNGASPAQSYSADISKSNTSSDFYTSLNGKRTPEVHVNGRRASSVRSMSTNGQNGDDGWGSHFWVTLIDPQTQVSFFACPATGEVSWDPPVGNFVLPPNPEGEWWEMTDEASGLPYYYHTKSGETVWEKPEAFVIPLGVLQNTALARRLSIRKSHPDKASSKQAPGTPDRTPYKRSQSYSLEDASQQGNSLRRSLSSSRSSPGLGSLQPVTPTPSTPSPSPSSKKNGARRGVTASSEQTLSFGASGGPLAYPRGHPLAPIPGSPYATDVSTPSSPKSRKSISGLPMNGHAAPSSESGKGKGKEKEREHGRERDSPPRRKNTAEEGMGTVGRARSKSSSYMSFRAPQPQSLTAALEMIALSDSQSSTQSTQSNRSNGTEIARSASEDGHQSPSPALSVQDLPPPAPARGKAPPSPRRPVPSAPDAPVLIGGKQISSPVYNPEATLQLSPAAQNEGARPIPVDIYTKTRGDNISMNTGKYPVLPHELASDIQQFAESHFAKQYFSTHRTGFIFRRKVPVAQLMSWQKAPLSSPLLMLNRSLHKDALKVFKVIQRIMGDRERDRPVGVRMQEAHASLVPAINGSATSLQAGLSSAVLEEERWLLNEGLTHGELRDEIFCQVMKQLTGNPNPESIFRGWQLLCVLLVTFPPSKNFETYLQAYMQQATTHQEGRVDVMAKYCLRRLAYISKKGPRGKPPSVAEIETASDAAFHPSIFGETLDAIFRLQERTYPTHKVPIILPFLADGILALGGTKAEGIFRVPGDADAVSDLKLRIEKGYYSLDGVDDPHVPASLLKLWLRELCDPLVPDELYNDCVANGRDPQACVQLVRRLPTINRRVVLFVISFLQVFLEDKILAVTKMTAPNLALVMAPNLLRCNSESMAIVFTNAQYEQSFVHNLLVHLRCNEVDTDYIPTHGQGAIASSGPPPKATKGRRR
ncbi:hypothetical protein CERSUDRAFT_119077 [Gelatoporia subvermispora B]|uniref:Rho GTPase-activating protein 39 n=1 Tax=Ceriporiopsis subvermispora (strain B) TaxID=914234 RepID=M2P9H8_CERS8|nr:hypothetical protein CERSUDRAFT_119077 [Gelatoporia subvermispora B]